MRLTTLILRPVAWGGGQPIFVTMNLNIQPFVVPNCLSHHGWHSTVMNTQTQKQNHYILPTTLEGTVKDVLHTCTMEREMKCLQYQFDTCKSSAFSVCQILFAVIVNAVLLSVGNQPALFCDIFAKKILKGKPPVTAVWIKNRGTCAHTDFFANPYPLA